MKPGAQSRTFDRFDWPLFGCVVLTLLLGLLNLFSATYNLPVAKFFRSQCIWIAAGLLISVALTIFDYRYLERLAYPIYGIVIVLLVVVLFWGKSALGAQRWIQLGPLSLQPSELVKPAIAFVLAGYFKNRVEGKPLALSNLFWPLVLTGIPFALILRQPDLGTALVVASIAFAVVIFVGVRRKVIILFVVAGIAMAPLAWFYVLRPYQKERVYSFLNPERDPLESGYQIIQSKIAIGSGELVGKGFLKGSQSKLQFLPKQHTDFVFSNFAEEFGFLGATILLALYLSMALLGLNVAFTAKDRFGTVLALGLTALIVSQAVINLGMEMGLLPVVGVTLPLFSYGGTSMLTTLLSFGILLNISMRRYMF